MFGKGGGGIVRGSDISCVLIGAGRIAGLGQLAALLRRDQLGADPRLGQQHHQLAFVLRAQRRLPLAGAGGARRYGEAAATTSATCACQAASAAITSGA